MKYLEKTIGNIKKWYNGKAIKNKPDSLMIIIGFEKHWTSRIANNLVKFVKTNYQWATGTLIAVIGIIKTL